jgi:hypothetical protein
MGGGKNKLMPPAAAKKSSKPKHKFNYRGSHWLRQQFAMLVVFASLPPRRRRLQLGAPSRSRSISGAKSLCHYTTWNNSLPAASGTCGLAVRIIRSRSCSGLVFWN